MKEIRVAVIGVGYAGTIHARKLLSMPEAKLALVVDVDRKRAEKVGKELNVPYCMSLNDGQLSEVDAAVVSVPAKNHYEVARPLVMEGKHVLIEKPFVTSISEGEELIELARKKGVLIGVGHSERFNPVTKILANELRSPGFIEGDRLSPFTNRCLDVDVVLDLMIHDLDILTHLLPRRVLQIDAVGVPVLTGKIDIANARIRMEGDCVINLTASRVSDKKMRKLRFFQPDSYISVDFSIPRISVKKRVTDDGGLRILSEEHMPEENDPLAEELRDFLRAIREGREPEVTAEEAMRPIKLALDILKYMKVPSA